MYVYMYVCMYVYMYVCMYQELLKKPQQIPCVFAHTWRIKLILILILILIMVLARRLFLIEIRQIYKQNRLDEHIKLHKVDTIINVT